MVRREVEAVVRQEVKDDSKVQRIVFGTPALVGGVTAHFSGLVSSKMVELWKRTDVVDDLDKFDPTVDSRKRLEEIKASKGG